MKFNHSEMNADSLAYHTGLAKFSSVTVPTL